MSQGQVTKVTRSNHIRSDVIGAGSYQAVSQTSGEVRLQRSSNFSERSQPQVTWRSLAGVTNLAGEPRVAARAATLLDLPRASQPGVPVLRDVQRHVVYAATKRALRQRKGREGGSEVGVGGSGIRVGVLG